VDLTVAAGEVVAVIGPNGAGKTTLLGGLAGLAAHRSGTLAVLGSTRVPGRVLRAPAVSAVARNGVAYVPEGRALFPSLTVADHLRLARPRGRAARRSGMDATDVLGWFPGLAAVADRPAGVLSGGEQQMLAVARAVVARPRLLLIDEMSLGLAPRVVAGLLDLVGEVATRHGVGVVVVEQHVSLALSVATTGVLMVGGRVVAAGPAAELAGRSDLLEAGYLGGPLAPG
jgi:branched-chain amino acid transport system ATP-binding protein